jgi:hypothetical protein
MLYVATAAKVMVYGRKEYNVETYVRQAENYFLADKLII